MFLFINRIKGQLLNNAVLYQALLVSILLITQAENITFFIYDDEVAAYYNVAYNFYKSEVVENFFRFFNPDETFGHPAMFPFLLGYFMKIFGVGSLAAKSFVLIISSIFILGFFKLSYLFTKNYLLASLSVIFLFLSPNYYRAFTMVLGDTAFLPVCVFCIYFFFNTEYFKFVLLSLLSAFTRELAVLVVGSLIISELVAANKKLFEDKRKMFILLLSFLLSLIWFGIGFLRSRLILNKFVTLDYKGGGFEKAHFDFSFEFWVNSLNSQLDFLLISEPILLFFVLLTFFSILFYKKQSLLEQKFLIFTLVLNIVSVCCLSFFTNFLTRYLLFSLFLFFITGFNAFKYLLEMLPSYFRFKKIVYYIPLFIYLIYIPNFRKSYVYGEYIDKQYSFLQKVLHFSDKYLDLTKIPKDKLRFFIAPYPMSLFLSDNLNLYPKFETKLEYPQDHFNKIQSQMIFYLAAGNSNNIDSEFFKLGYKFKIIRVFHFDGLTYYLNLGRKQTLL